MATTVQVSEAYCSPAKRGRWPAGCVQAVCLLALLLALQGLLMLTTQACPGTLLSAWCAISRGGRERPRPLFYAHTAAPAAARVGPTQEFPQGLATPPAASHPPHLRHNRGHDDDDDHDYGHYGREKEHAQQQQPEQEQEEEKKKEVEEEEREEHPQQQQQQQHQQQQQQQEEVGVEEEQKGRKEVVERLVGDDRKGEAGAEGDGGHQRWSHESGGARSLLEDIPRSTVYQRLFWLWGLPECNYSAPRAHVVQRPTALLEWGKPLPDSYFTLNSSLGEFLAQSPSLAHALAVVTAAVAPQGISSQQMAVSETHSPERRRRRRRLLGLLASGGGSSSSHGGSSGGRSTAHEGRGGQLTNRRLNALQGRERNRGAERDDTEDEDDDSSSGRKYLFALCTGGQMSNRLLCWRHYLVYAALLNRTLILPMHDLRVPGFNYNVSAVLDFEHLRACLGEDRVVTPEEYMAAEGVGRVDVRMLCWHECTRPEWRRGLGVSAPYLRVKGGRFLEIPGNETSVPVELVVAMFGRGGAAGRERVISLGEAFRAPTVWGLPFNAIGSALVHRVRGCGDLMRPHPVVLRAAKAFVEERLGNRYAALHLRRGDFVDFCRTRPCWCPIDMLAACTARRLVASLQHVGTPLTVYLATNADDEELRQFERAVAHRVAPHFGNVTFVHMPDFSHDSPWVRLLRDQGGWHLLEEVRAAFEKIVCARASLFLGTMFSTFSRDIFRLRASSGRSFCSDDYMCGSIPDDVAPTCYPPDNSVQNR